MPFLELSDGDRLYYEVHGEGPPLLLVSGLSGVSSFWSVHVEPLAERFMVVVYDHRGVGRSTPSRIDDSVDGSVEYSVEHMAGDVLQLLDGLGIERTHLIGHSTGGAIGQVLAIERPERVDRLVLSATWTAADDYFRRLFEVRAEMLRRGGAPLYVRANALFMRPGWWTRDHISELEAQEAEAVRQMPPAEIMLARIAAILRFDRRAELHSIGAPTLVIVARDDVVTPPYYSEELGRLIPAAETIVLAQGGHFLPQVFPELFRGVVLEFLDRNQPAAR